jgi:voltage-gated potassium channel
MTRPKLPFHIGRRKFSVAHLVMTLVAMFILLPFVDTLHWGSFIEGVAFTIVLLAAVGAVGGRRRTLVIAILLVAPALFLRWFAHIWPDFVPLGLSHLASFVFVVFVIMHLFRFVMTAPSVNEEVIYAAVSVYLLIAVAWAFLFRMLAHADPDAFAFTVPQATGNKMQGFTAMYYSVGSLSSVSFGDIMPVSNVARMLVLLEAVVGLFYMTIMIARLVSLYTSSKQNS